MSSTTKDGASNAAGHHIHEDRDASRVDERTRTASFLMESAELKHEEGGPDVTMADARPSYKSWKKKYRKMRIKFDESMAHGEQLYQQEQKALKKIKQLAIYNEQASPSRTLRPLSRLGTKLFVIELPANTRTAVYSICSQTSTTHPKSQQKSASTSASTSLPTPRRPPHWTSIGNRGLALDLPKLSRT